jgi:hypothetical protein
MGEGRLVGWLSVFFVVVGGGLFFWVISAGDWETWLWLGWLAGVGVGAITWVFLFLSFSFLALAFGWGRDQIDWLHCSSMAVVLCNTVLCVLWDEMRKGGDGSPAAAAAAAAAAILYIYHYRITYLLLITALPTYLPA